MVWPREKFLGEVQSKLTESEIHDPANVVLPPYYPIRPSSGKRLPGFTIA
jgi:hypothetical protein